MAAKKEPEPEPTSAAILLLAYSMRMAPRSELSRKVPCRAAITCAAHRTSWYSMNATGDPPLLCMRRRQKPGKLCNTRIPHSAELSGGSGSLWGHRARITGGDSQQAGIRGAPRHYVLRVGVTTIAHRNLIHCTASYPNIHWHNLRTPSKKSTKYTWSLYIFRIKQTINVPQHLQIIHSSINYTKPHRAVFNTNNYLEDIWETPGRHLF